MSPMKRGMTTLVLLGAAFALVAHASAHAFLNASDPGAGATVSTPPKVVRLTFSEPVEIRFSIFKVYRLNVSSVTDARALNAAADALVSEDLLKRGDEASRSDDGVANTTRTSTDIVLRLKDLDPGAYVLMWRVLSVDTHTTQGSFVFIYTPVRSWARAHPHTGESLLDARTHGGPRGAGRMSVDRRLRQRAPGGLPCRFPPLHSRRPPCRAVTPQGADLLCGLGCPNLTRSAFRR